MFTKTKITMVALLIAAVATPSFARDHQYHPKYERSYAAPLIEGRNAAAFGAFSGTFTDRESMVQTPGN